MANFTAADIKALREQTAAGMMDVKRALEEADGDMAQAAEILRIKGLKGVTKREGRSASNGLVAAKVENGVGTLVEVNCETDFVAKGERLPELGQLVQHDPRRSPDPLGLPLKVRSAERRTPPPNLVRPAQGRIEERLDRQPEDTGHFLRVRSKTGDAA